MRRFATPEAAVKMVWRRAWVVWSGSSSGVAEERERFGDLGGRTGRPFERVFSWRLGCERLDVRAGTRCEGALEGDRGGLETMEMWSGEGRLGA